MAFNNVVINQSNGGSGRPRPGFDYYSALILYGTHPNVTGKWNLFKGSSPYPDINAQQMFSVGDISDAGIIPYTDNTAASAMFEITNAATAAGETVSISVTVPKPNSTNLVVNFGIYTTVSGDTTTNTLGVNLTAFINSGTVIHGYSATYNSGTSKITITAIKTVGISLNTGTPLAFGLASTTITGTITQFSGGTASQFAIWDYHIREYFRLNQTGNLWVGIISSSSSFNEIITLQTKAASSKVRYIGVYDKDATRGLGANILSTIRKIDVAAKVLQKSSPLSVFYSPNTFGVTDFSSYVDQNLNTSNKVTSVISQDGNAAGALLFVTSGQSIGNVGAILGCQSKSRVSASFAQAINDYNVSDGIENDIAAFSNGQLSTVVSDNLQIQLDNYRYTFFRKFGDEIVGTYWTDNKTCINSSSDYAFVNDNAVFDKVSRICYSTYIPLLSSEIYFNKDGTLKDYSIEYFRDQGVDAITASMITGFGSNPLISGVSISIDSTQNVKATNNLTVVVTINENGIARNITVNVGFGNA